MIELVIKIPEEVRLALINNIQLSPDQKSISDAFINTAIINGTPLEEELVAELLDLWAEIDIYEAPIYDQPYCRGLKKAMEFIDKRISELKGENNDT